MKMSVNVEDLVLDMTRLNVDAALHHAALASLACTAERTLGPDRPLWSELAKKKTISQNNTPEPAPAPTLSKKEPIRQTADSATPDSNFPDVVALNNSIVKRELAQQCKRSVRSQLDSLQQRQQLANSRDSKVAQQQAEQQQQRQQRLALKQQHDNLIEQQAEQLAQADLELRQRELNVLRRQTEQKVQEISFQGVARYQLKFRGKYESVAKVLLALDKDTQQACGALNRQLRELVQLFDQLIGKIKAGSCGPQELKTAEQLYQSLNEIEANFTKELKQLSHQFAQQQQQLKMDEANRAKQLAEEKQRAVETEQERLRQLQQQQQQQEQEQETQAQAAAAPQATEAAAPAAAPIAAPTAAPTSNTNSGISSSYVHPTRLAFYNEINQIYQSKVDSVKPLQTDEAWKKYRTNCQRAINMPLNAITAVSAQHLTLNFEKLYNFFAGQPVKTTDGGAITINDHPLARDYCMLLMAKKFVSQTETAISSNPQAAFPFASVIVTFWKLLPDFGKIFLAYIFKESPYLVPYIIPQQPGQTPEQYLKSIGYRLSDRNELEKPDMYLKRQTGIARLYAAVIITPGRKMDGPLHPFGLEEAWRWLTHMVLVKPLPDICATLIMEMLQTLGFELWRAYGRQFLKLLLYIQQHYLPQLTAYDEGGPKARLEMLLAKFMRERQIPQAVGVLPPGFW